MLNALVKAKENMRTALEDKGVEITGGLTTYADAIIGIEAYEPTFVLPDGTCLAYCRTTDVFDHYDFSQMHALTMVFRGSTIDKVYNFNATGPDWTGAFYENKNLKTVRGLNLSGATQANEMFKDCTALVSIDRLDFSDMYDCDDMFSGCSSLTTVGGLQNFGYCSGLSGTAYPRLMTTNMFLGCKSLSRESMLNIFNDLYDLTKVDTEDYMYCNLQFPTVVLENLTDEEIAIATNKRWFISGKS